MRRDLEMQGTIHSQKFKKFCAVLDGKS